MPWFEFIWDERENLAHLAEHDLGPKDVEDIVRFSEFRAVSRSTGREIVFGQTPSGRNVCVVFEQIDPLTVYVITAYEVD